MTTYTNDKSIKSIFGFIKEALSTKQQDFTTGSIRKAIFLLAIPMILEMCMESVFAIVDIFFVGKTWFQCHCHCWFNRISSYYCLFNCYGT